MVQRSIILASSERATATSSFDDECVKSPLPTHVRLPLHQGSQDSSPPRDEDDENDSLGSSVSSLSLDQDLLFDSTRQESTSSGSSWAAAPRSIFASYWETKGEGGPTSPVCQKKHMVFPPTRAVSPVSVMARNTTLGMEGILDLQRALQEDEEDDLLNTYERTLKDCEAPRRKSLYPYQNAPLWMSWFSHRSEPSLRPSLWSLGVAPGGGGAGLHRSRQGQSDSALLCATPPLVSALRRGRFSSTKGVQVHNIRASTPPSGQHVRFQPRIEVRAYQPPMESWSAEGWSQLFGI